MVIARKKKHQSDCLDCDPVFLSGAHKILSNLRTQRFQSKSGNEQSLYGDWLRSLASCHCMKLDLHQDARSANHLLQSWFPHPVEAEKIQV